jgi:hypothetical protein
LTWTWPQTAESVVVRFSADEPPTWDPVPNAPGRQDLRFTVVE